MGHRQHYNETDMAENVKVEEVIHTETELPPGWHIVGLADVAEIIMGQSPSSKYYNTEGDGLPFFQGKAEFGDLYPEVIKWCTRPNKIAQKDDVLISVRAPVGPTNLAPSECCIGRGLAAIRPQGDIPSKYILYYLRSIKSDIEALGTGTTFQAISGKVLRSIPVPIAPPEQQKLIVAEIEKQFSRLDEAVANLKRVKANLKRYKAAVLKAAVEGKLTEQWRKEHPNVEPASKLLERIIAERRKRWEGKGKYKEPTAPDTTNLPELPKGWVWARTDQLFWFVTSGSRGWADYYSEAGPLFLRIGNLDHDSISLDLSDTQRVQPPAGAEGMRTRVEPGDILISITADVGMVALVPSHIEEAYINQHVSLARPVSVVNRSYLAWFLCSQDGQKQFKELQRGATKVGLSLDDINAVNVPLPSFSEQAEIVQEIERRLSVSDEIGTVIEANFQRADRLRQSILSKAFSGKLLTLRDSMVLESSARR
jgi:type I restriction enzyme S subunit